MELLQLKYFRAAANCGNFSRAAELVGVPQSAISKTIANLERELGYLLFTRSGKHVQLNNYGRLFLAGVDMALNSLDDGRKALAELADQQQGNIRLADLRPESFISLASCKSLRRMTDASCSLFGFQPKVIFESDDAATVRGLIENGLGVAFIPVKTWTMDRSDQIRFLPITDIACRRTLAVSWFKNRYLSAPARDFRQFAIDWYRRL